jgi:hypothetical protein
MKKKLNEKLKESLSAVLPITLIVLILAISITPMSGELTFLFLLGAAMLVVGMGLFTLGSGISMVIMGEKVGAGLVRTKNIWLILPVCFIIGVFITVAEPDLSVLAGQLPLAGKYTIIFSVAIGVGIFLLLAFMRMLLNVKLNVLLMLFYVAVLGLALSPLIPNDFIPAAFDSGGVTTGPVTVPFIMSLGLGLASIRGDKYSHDDTFGLVSLCSVGPILTIMLLGAFSNNSDVNVDLPVIPEYSNVHLAFVHMLHEVPETALEVGKTILPVALMFLVFQLVMVKLNNNELFKVIVGLVLTSLGLTMFLTGVNVGFMPVGMYLGRTLASGTNAWLLIPLGALIGYFIVSAEPAVHILKNQVEDITLSKIKGKTLGIALSIGVAVSVAAAMLRVTLGIPLIYFLLPGYTFSLVMMFFVPPLYTAVAFDSGGVASGPMTATFLLPLAMGACQGTAEKLSATPNMAQDAFGIVAMVALTPLITIQLLGLVSVIKSKGAKKNVPLTERLDDEDIIDLVNN